MRVRRGPRHCNWGRHLRSVHWGLVLPPLAGVGPWEGWRRRSIQEPGDLPELIFGERGQGVSLPTFWSTYQTHCPFSIFQVLGAGTVIGLSVKPGIGTIILQATIALAFVKSSE